MTAHWQLKVLGPPQVADGVGGPVRFRTKKQLALLVYLHFEGRTRRLGRDGLVELLWPGVAVELGRHSLSQALVAIRARLGAEALTRREQDVQLLVPLRLDLDGLGEGEVPEQLGEPLAGLEDCAGAEFAHWVEGARVRIRSQVRERLRGALKAARGRGDLSLVHRVARLLYRLDPLCAESVYALAERALLEGDTVQAVRLLKDFERRVQAEVGSNPHPELARLLRRLERGERPSCLAVPGDVPLGYVRREVFVGREVELASLEALWDRVKVRGYGACLVTGPPGIGKSSLIRRFATSLAARAWPVFVVSCQEIGQGIPYAAVADLFLALGREPQAGGTDPGWLAEASRVCPGLRTIYPGIPPVVEAPADSVPLRVAEALLRMVEAVTDGGPVLIGFDDIQHMDPASRNVLFLATRRLERVPVLLLATGRFGGLEPVSLAAVERPGWEWAQRIELQPLALAEAERLVSDLMGGEGAVDPRIRETVVRLAQGNPYHLELLLGDWQEHEARWVAAVESGGDLVLASWEPPETLRSAFERHYQGLSGPARHMLQVLAVAERSMAPVEVAPIAGLASGVAEQVALEILARGIGRVERGRLGFKNELHRASVYYEMDAERRKYFHGRLAAGLDGGAGSDDFQRMLEASHHYLGAREPERACQTAIRGAELATRRGAPGEAERALAALLRAYPQGAESRVHLVRAHALVAEGRYREGLEALGVWGPASPLPADRALAAQLRAEALHRARLADDRVIFESAGAAVALAREAGVHLTLIRALQVQAEVAADSGQLEGVAEAGVQAQLVAEQSGDRECRALATLMRGYCLLTAGQLEEAAGVFVEAALELRELGLLVELRQALNGLGISHTGLARMAEAAQSFREAILVARKVGDRVAIANLWTNLGVTCHEAGLYEIASSCYDQAIACEPLTSRGRATLYCNLTRLATERGDCSAAEQHLDRAISAATESGLWSLIAAAELDRADLRLSLRDEEQAWRCVEHAVAITGERAHLIGDPGQFLRLHLHWVWATKGYRFATELKSTALFRSAIRTVADALEIRAFEEWMDRVETGSATPETGFQSIVERGLFGVLSRLIAVGVRFQAIPQVETGESSAQLIARLFPARQQLRLPRLDDLL